MSQDIGPLRRFVAWSLYLEHATLGGAGMNANVASRWRVLLRSSAVMLGLALSAFVACTSDDGASGPPDGDPADCRLIANRCHPYDDDSMIAEECHEVGHDGASPARCTTMKASCLEECPPLDPDAGMGGSSGSASGGTGATSSGGSGAGEPGGGAGESSGGAGAPGTAGQGGTSSGGTGTGGMPTGGTGGAAGTVVTPDGGETACETLGRVCHGIGAGFTEECHELGHDGDEQACEAELAACLAACQDGGV